MRDVIEIKPNLFWIGIEDPQLRVFGDLFPAEHGTTYYSYLIKGNNKIAIIDTIKSRYWVDQPAARNHSR